MVRMASGGSNGSDFVHLHVHSEYSMLVGAARVGEMLAEAQRLGQTAMAITDHGYLFGAFDFYSQARKLGIKPIIGVEAYVTPGTSRFDQTRVRWGEAHQAADDVSARGAYTHMTLLSRTTEGMHNLFRMGSLASLEGQMGKWPRMDRELLQTYSAGLIATSGCPSSEVQTRLRLGHWDEAVRAAGELQDIFGKENFFVEVMDHGLEIERRTVKDLIRLAEQIGAPLVATNDLHYTTKDDAHAHEVLLAVQSGSTLDEPTYDQGGSRFAFGGDGYYVKSAAEMRRTWAELPEAVDNTVLIAERCEVEFPTGANYMPRFPVPAGEDENSWFVKEVEAGLQRRYKGNVPDDVRKQAEYETGVIVQLGFSGYFLVVADFIQWAKDQGIRVGPGRGSAAGSMASYAMGITELDPLRHGLIFERFLNPERVSWPDVDVDFDERRRGEVIRYVTEKYGDDRVAQIVTYGTIKAKQALKDSSRVLGFPFAMGEKLTKAMPPAVMGKDIPLSGIFDPQHKRYAEAVEFRQVHDEDPQAQEVVKTALGLEGLKRQWGVHAAGVIMSSEPLLDLIPIMRREQDGQIITQFDYPSCETLGLVKMDFLGLRNLTILDDALLNVRTNRGEEIDLDELSKTLDDPATYELLGRGDTLGVFQFDGGPMRALLRLMKPDNFEDISAVGALYRPGPMGVNSHTNYALRKNGQQEITPIHPELEEPLREVLEPTYGLIVYQEQVQKAAQILAGYTLGQADLLRRAMGKKKKEILDKEFVPFQQGCRVRGYYDKDKSSLYLSECRRMGIKVLPPDVNESVATFAPVGTDSRVGLAAIRNVGSNVVEAIIAARKSKGEFTGFSDFLRKVPLVVCNKRVIESLIKAGAFDSFQDARKGLVLVHEQAVDAVIDIKRNEAIGQDSLFGGDIESDAVFDVPVPAGEWDKSTLLNFEREMLGLYVSDHPLFGIEHIIARESDCSLADLMADEAEPRPRAGDRSDAQIVKIGGILSGVQRKVTKQGNQWAAATLEDLGGAIEVLFFPQTYQLYATSIAEDAVVVVKGKVDRRDDVPKLIAMDMTIPDLSVDDSGPFVVSMPVARCVPPVVERLREVLVTHPGPTEVHLKLRGHERTTLVRLDDKLRVATSPALIGDLKQLLGPACVS